MTRIQAGQQKTLCVGRGFAESAVTTATAFPALVLSQSDDFAFTIEPDLPAALQHLQARPRYDLLFVDADAEPLPVVLSFVHEVRQQWPRLPIIAFSERGGDAMRYLLREGARWHFTKRSRAIAHLSRSLRRHVPLISHGEVWGATAKEPPDAPPIERWRNPYVVGRPLTGPSEALYAGREDIFAWFDENLGADRPNALLLYGERRIGKTSTLYQLVVGERGRGLRDDPRRPLVTAYVDLQRLAGCRTDEWLRRLGRDIYRQAAASGRSLAADNVMPRSSAPGDSAFAAIERAFDHLEQILPAEALVVVALDELEQIGSGVESGRLDPAVLPYLRSQIQHRPRLAFVLSGSFGLLDDYWRPIVDLTARRELGPLDEAAAERLIRQPVAAWLGYEDDAVTLIQRHCNGRPLQIQALCHHLVAYRIECLRRREGPRGPVSVAEVEWAIGQLAGADSSPAEPRLMATEPVMAIPGERQKR